VLIGVAFGFVLERSGFGRAPILAAQFYGSDTRVLKVMFTAIVTALLGMTVLSGAGLLDLSMVAVPETFLWPQLVGGVLLGVGFIVSGYCPGTSWVSAASGNLDGFATIGGVLVGGFVFGLVYPALEGFYGAGAMGVVRLPDLLGVPQALVAAGVAAMAVGAFLFGEWAERFFAARRDEIPPAPERSTRNRVFAGFGVAAVGGLALMAVPGPAPEGRPVATAGAMDAVALAKALVSDPSRLYVVDVRPAVTCAAARIPGAACIPAVGGIDAAVAAAPAGRTLVLYGETDLPEVPAAALDHRGAVAVLKGGYAAFTDQVLRPPTVPFDPTPAALAEHRRRLALTAYFTGVKSAPPPPAVPAAPAAPRATPGGGVKKGGGC
jgi:hypothetical protein